MKIVFLTTQPNAACSMFYSGAFRTIDEMSFYDANLAKFDVALLMTYDHSSISHIKKNFPSLKVGIIDPRNEKVIESAKQSDFLIVDSLEMEDYWRCVNKPIFRYVEYPDILTVKKTHVDHKPIVIGYHGNKIHLECMSKSVTPALESLGSRYNIELLTMYSGISPSPREAWYPKNIKVTHVQWNMDAYVSHLSKCDIGIVPNNILHDSKEKRDNALDRNFNYSNDDYSLRFKMPSNPGRFVIFGKLGIPVVADFYPSALQLLSNDVGYVAHNVAGWEYCLEQLITSSQKRQMMGDALQRLVEEKFDFSTQNANLLQFLRTLK